MATKKVPSTTFNRVIFVSLHDNAHISSRFIHLILFPNSIVNKDMTDGTVRFWVEMPRIYRAREDEPPLWKGMIWLGVGREATATR